MKRLSIVIATLSLASNVSAENIFKSLWSGIKDRPDLSKTHSNLSKVGNRFFVYKLKHDEPNRSVDHASVISTSDETSIPEVRIVNNTHPDNKPHVDIIDNVTEADEHSSKAHQNEREIVFGANSPLQDDAVLAAWERANRAKRELEKHREYMERVRKARVDVEQSKRISIANQTGVKSE
jgi:hypothetical protein